MQRLFDGSTTWKPYFLSLFPKVLLLAYSLTNLVVRVISYINTRQNSPLEDVTMNITVNAMKSVGGSQQGMQSAEFAPSSLDVMDATNMRDLLREAEVRNEALKIELEHINSLRISLEEICGQQEQEKNEVEDKLEELQLDYAIRIEELTDELDQNLKELGRVEKEKEILKKQVESLARRDRTTEGALRTQAYLIERLECAEEEVAQLQQSLLKLQAERDAALAIAANNLQADMATHKGLDLRERGPERVPEGYETIVDSNESFLADQGGSFKSTDPEEEKSLLDLKLGPVTGSDAFRNFLSMIVKE